MLTTVNKKSENKHYNEYAGVLLTKIHLGVGGGWEETYREKRSRQWKAEMDRDSQDRWRKQWRGGREVGASQRAQGHAPKGDRAIGAGATAKDSKVHI